MRALLTAAVVALALPAAAAPYQVEPVRLVLSPDRRSTMVTVTNTGDREISFQVTARAWAQTPAGEEQLIDSPDVVFFPKLFSVAPGASRKVRVGLDPGAAAPVREASYRLFVEELPAHREAGAGGMSMLVRMSIPIFVPPARAVAEGRVAGLGVTGGRAGFAVQASGTAHLRTRSVRLTGMDAAGARVFEKAAAGSYVLAGGERRYAFDIDGDACARVRALVVEVELEDGHGLQQRVELAAAACSP